MNYYYNCDLGICADETWVVDYLVIGGSYDNRAKAREDLQTQRETYGWVSCQLFVSN